MNKLKTTMLVGVATATVGTAGAAVVQNASAMSGKTDQRTETKMDYQSTYDAKLTEALVKKFNLNETDVASVIAQVRADQKNDMKKEWTDTLDKALSDGKLTQEQYDHIVLVFNDINDLRDSWQDKTKDERTADTKEIATKWNDLRDWMKDQDLSFKSLGFDWSPSHRWDEREHRHYHHHNHSDQR